MDAAARSYAKRGIFSGRPSSPNRGSPEPRWNTIWIARRKATDLGNPAARFAERNEAITANLPIGISILDHQAICVASAGYRLASVTTMQISSIDHNAVKS